MKKVLLYYNFSFSFGGGDFLPLSFIAELQNACDLTVALDKTDGLRQAAEIYGITIDPSAFKVEQVTPKGYDIKRHNAYLSLYRARKLKSLPERPTSASRFPTSQTSGGRRTIS